MMILQTVSCLGDLINGIPTAQRAGALFLLSLVMMWKATQQTEGSDRKFVLSGLLGFLFLLQGILLFVESA